MHNILVLILTLLAVTALFFIIIYSQLICRVPTHGYDWRKILHGQTDPCAPLVCQISRESVKWVTPAWRKCRFWPTSKFNTGSLPFRGNRAAKRQTAAFTRYRSHSELQWHFENNRNHDITADRQPVPLYRGLDNYSSFTHTATVHRKKVSHCYSH